MPSPFDLPDPFGNQPVVRPPAPAPLPPLTPQEQSSLLEKIGAAGLGGLGFIGGILNKPGRIIRGALGGHFDELGNLIPFSDALGITDPSREVRGQDLLGAKDASFFSPEGLAGFGVDVLTDPLTYLSFGGHALTKAGVAAKKVGTLPTTVAERAAQGLGGHVGVGLPFAGNAATADLAPLGNAINTGIGMIPGGQMVMDAAGRASSALGDLYSRTVKPLFQKSVMGQTDPLAQGVASEVSSQIPGVQAAARQRVMGIADQLGEANLTQQGGRDLRVGLESPNANLGPLDGAIASQRAYQADLLNRVNQAGLPDQVLNDPAVSYAARQATVLTKSEKNALEASLAPAGQLPGREKILKGIPTEGPGSINDLTRRKDLLPMRGEYNAGNTLPLEQEIKKNYLHVDDNEIATLRSQVAAAIPGTAPQASVDHLAQLEAHAKQAEDLANWVATSVPEDLAKQGLGYFDRHPLLDLADKAVRDETRILKANGLYRAVAKMAQPGEGTQLGDVLKSAGLTFKGADGQPVAMTRMMEALQAEGKLPAGATLKDLDGLAIPADQVARVTRFTKAATSPVGLTPFLGLWDSATNLTKGFQTALWPANWTRNQTQALFQNWVHDAYNAQHSGPMSYLKPLIDAKKWRDGGVIEGAAKYPGMAEAGFHTDEMATKQLQKEIAGLNVANAFKHPEADIAGGELATKQLLPDVPGAPRKGFGEILKGYLPKSKAEMNPFSVGGVGENLADTFAPIKAGRELNQELHAVDRVSTYLAKRSQGFVPEAALNEVDLAHYNFGNTTQFENSVMKRLVPFYNFARQNVPAVVSEIAENPGGKLATAVKGAVAMRGEHPGFMRPDVAQGVAAPIGGEENGQQRYLNHFGLGFEDLGQLAGPGGGPLGMLNPLIKAPIEAMTGKQMFTGRDLRDLHSRVGDVTGTPLPVGENLLMNSPVGRLLSTAGTLADQRKSIADKAVNTLSGFRLTDVDAEAARRNAVRDYIAEQMHGPGISQYTDFAVKPENVPFLSPLQQQLFQLHRQLQSRRPLPLAGM